jgi:hypothetical protein
MASRAFHPCVEQVTHSKISVSEKGKTVTFANQSRAKHERVRVDDCMVKSGPRADWIITKVGVGSVVIELKGRDVGHAVDQIFATISHQDCIQWIERPTKLLIVCAKFPSFDTKIARAQVRARKQGMSLKIVCRSFSCTVEEL